MFMSTNAANQTLVQQQLFSYQMSEGDNIKKYLARYLDVITQLTTLIPTFDKTTIVVTLLNSLPPLFEGFRTAVFAKDTLPDLEWVKTQLLIMDVRRGHTLDPKSGAALYSQCDEPELTTLRRRVIWTVL